MGDANKSGRDKKWIKRGETEVDGFAVLSVRDQASCVKYVGCVSRRDRITKDLVESKKWKKGGFEMQTKMQWSVHGEVETAEG
jgi:hypothetical protein